jgi:hypothetical protein
LEKLKKKETRQIPWKIDKKDKNYKYQVKNREKPMTKKEKLPLMGRPSTSTIR